jgi:hypothetical protein
MVIFNKIWPKPLLGIFLSSNTYLIKNLNCSEKSKTIMNKQKPSYFFLIIALIISSCKSDNNKEISSTLSQLSRISKLKAEAPLVKGITVVPDPTPSTPSQECDINAPISDDCKIFAQVQDFLSNSTQEVKNLFGKKSLVIGITENDSSEDMPYFESLKMSGYAIELIYTDNGEEDGLTTYQKLMQLWDYYVDTPALDAELKAAYDPWIKGDCAIEYDPCAAYGNKVNGCKVDEDPTDPDYDPDPEGGTRDIIHPAGMDLNSGAVLGILYETTVDLARSGFPPGEFNLGNYNSSRDRQEDSGEVRDFIASTVNLGPDGCTTNSGFNDYSLKDPEFDKMYEFLKKHFGKDRP